jgi:DNA-binding protein HU-beta
MELRIEKPELAARVPARTLGDAGTVEQGLDATLEETDQALKRVESVSLRNFGTFYMREERSTWVRRFNPSWNNTPLRISPAHLLPGQESAPLHWRCALQKGTIG